MPKNSDDTSNMSLDSLEENFKRKLSVIDDGEDERSVENVETILVPFYEQDVLVKIPKVKCIAMFDKNQKKLTKSFLLNKRKEKSRKNSYLEIFRKENTSVQEVKEAKEPDIRSISPQFGDTDLEHMSEDPVTDRQEFINTEAYNEIYYEKIIQQELNQNMDCSYDDDIKFTKNIENKSPVESYLLKSVSETSIPKRVFHSSLRRKTTDALHNIKLGGLGPDMEAIKPRLDRARSLQRYSERVRMENRLKIYKKSLEAEKQKQNERNSSAKRQNPEEILNIRNAEKKSSYLIKPSKNKNVFQQLSKNNRSKFSDIRESIPTRTDRDNEDKKLFTKQSRPQSISTGLRAKDEKVSSCRKKSGDNFKPNTTETTIIRNDDIISPVHISFMVNLNGLRPSSALRTLEAKHVMYQEKVKKFAFQKEHCS